jgi:hypothetical protein
MVKHCISERCIYMDSIYSLVKLYLYYLGSYHSISSTHLSIEIGPETLESRAYKTSLSRTRSLLHAFLYPVCEVLFFRQSCDDFYYSFNPAEPQQILHCISNSSIISTQIFRAAIMRWVVRPCSTSIFALFMEITLADQRQSPTRLQRPSHVLRHDPRPQNRSGDLSRQTLRSLRDVPSLLSIS